MVVGSEEASKGLKVPFLIKPSYYDLRGDAKFYFILAGNLDRFRGIKVPNETIFLKLESSGIVHETKSIVGFIKDCGI